MDNKQVAETLDEIGSLLEIKGESSFRTGAYHRAADVVRFLTDDISAIYERGEIKKIPRIGESIAIKIGELLSSGKLQYLEQLRTEVPTSLRKLMLIPGVGPKTAKLIFDVTGIADISELKKAAESGQLQGIKRLGKKTEDNIVRGINQLEQRTGRMRMDEAYDVARPLVEDVKKHPSVLACEYAGSLRRMKETVGDIDILASSEKPEEVIEHFTTLALVEYVVAKGPTKASVLTSQGLPVDLRVVAPEQWGAALQYFTGSKEHSVHLRGIARSKKLKISEYGVFDEDGKIVAGASEEEVYNYFNMPLIPPVLREDKGEIQAALEGRLPDLIKETDIKGDLHVHSKHSDGLSSIREMAETVIPYGYEYIAITDHAEKLYIAGGLTIDEIHERQKEIDETNAALAGQIRILSGLEVNIDNDGKVDYENDVLESLDIVVASVHGGFRQSKEQLTKRILAVMENPYVHIIGHPTARVINKRQPYEIDLEAVFKKAAETGTCLEINAFPDRLDLKDDHIRKAIDMGVTLCINTDAHRPRHLGFMKFGIATAQRGWAKKADVLNTLAIDQLLIKLKEITGNKL